MSIEKLHRKHSKVGDRTSVSGLSSFSILIILKTGRGRLRPALFYNQDKIYADRGSRQVTCAPHSPGPRVDTSIEGLVCQPGGASLRDRASSGKDFAYSCVGGRCYGLPSSKMSAVHDKKGVPVDSHALVILPVNQAAAKFDSIPLLAFGPAPSTTVEKSAITKTPAVCPRVPFLSRSAGLSTS